MHQKTQNHFLKFSIHLSVRKSRENYRQIYGKSKASLWRNLAQVRPQIFLGQSFALQLQFTINIFFRTAVLPKLFDNRFLYKYCNFSHVCLLVKMASKTVTRSINLDAILSPFIVTIYTSLNLQQNGNFTKTQYLCLFSIFCEIRGKRQLRNSHCKPKLPLF